MHKNIAQTISSILIAVVIIVGLICTTKSNLFITNTTALWIMAGIYLSLFFRFAVFGWAFDQIKGKNIIALKTGMISLLISLILLCFLPWKYGRVLTDNHIEKMRLSNPEIIIHVENNSNEASLAQEVWISAIKENNKDYNLQEIPLDNDKWYFNEGNIYTAGPSENDLTIRFRPKALYEIQFKAMPTSGIIRVTSGNDECIIDLYSSNEHFMYLDWSALYGRITTAPQILRVTYYLFYLLIIWSMMFFTVTYLTVKLNKEEE